MAALVDSRMPWAPHRKLLRPRGSSESLGRHNSPYSQQRSDHPSVLDNPTLSTSLRQNQAIVPDTTLRHLSRVHVYSHSRPPTSGPSSCPLPSGVLNDNLSPPPPRQLHSSNPRTLQNHLPFPSFRLPPNLDLTAAMLALVPEIPLRRANKLRKPTRIPSNPPVLAPLSFIEVPELDLDFEHISHDVPHPSSQPQRLSLTTESVCRQDAPTAELCDQHILRPARKLTKPRKSSPPPLPKEQVVPSSTGAAAAAAMTGDPAALISTLTSMSSPTSLSTPRARSDVGHGLRSSVSIKRSSLIKRFSMRAPKPSVDSQATSSGVSTSTGGRPSTPISSSHFSGSMRIWSKWRGAHNELGHDGMNDDPPISLTLPQVRITSPFPIHLTSDAQGEVKPRSELLPPARTDSPGPSPRSPTIYESVSPSNPITSDDSAFSRHRAKFTLEGNESEAELSSPPSPKIGIATPDYSNTHQSHSAPPSRVHSSYNPQYLSPLSRPEPTIKPPRRRWTFAMAMTDEDITDEVLVKELERMRLHKEWSGSVDEMDEIWDPDYVLFGTFEVQELSESPREACFPGLEHSEHKNNILRHSRPASSYTPSSTAPHRNNSVPVADSGSSGSSQQWQTARRMLLICRELVRTERHYLTSLRTLLASETEGAPPPLMLRYVEHLVDVSESYLAQMEGNPNSWGVAAAFLAVEEVLESAFVGWCGVVGMWFDGTRDETAKSGDSGALSVQTRRLSKKLGEDLNKEEEESTMSRIRKISTWRRSFPGIADLTPHVPSVKRREKGSAPPPSFSLYNHTRQRRSSQAKKPSIRDLAILPTQRIMRYVLLYRDLLEHTPATSPSRSLIKRAADAAFRIAQNCDRAQNNSAFIVDNNSSHNKNDNREASTHGTTTNTTTTSSSELDTEFSQSISKLDSSGTVPISL